MSVKNNSYNSPVVQKIEHLLGHLFTRIILYLTDGFLIAGGGLLIPIFALFVETVGGGILEAGTAVTIFALTAGVGILFFSRIEDNFKHYPQFVTVGYGIATLGYLIYIFTTSLGQLYFAQFLLGIAAAIRVPSYDVLLSQHSPKHLAVAWGNWNATVYFVSALSATFGAIIAATFGFTTMLTIVFFFSLISFILSFFLLRSPDNNHRPQEQKKNTQRIGSSTKSPKV